MIRRRLRRQGGRLIATCVGSVAGWPAHAQLAGAASDEVSPWRVVGALMLCLLLAVAGAFALRARLGGGTQLFAAARSDRRLRLIESIRIGPQAQLSIIACDGAELLVAVSAQGAQLLDRLERSATDRGAAPPCD